MDALAPRAIVAVRPFERSDVEPVMRVWSLACDASHSFLAPGFIAEAEREMRAVLATQTTFVFDDAGVKGFVSLSPGVVQALFVEPSCQRRGIGRRLLNRAKEEAEELTLAVFTQNTNAILFYHREGFFVVERRVYPPAASEALIMRWTRD